MNLPKRWYTRLLDALGRPTPLKRRLPDPAPPPDVPVVMEPPEPEELVKTTVVLTGKGFRSLEAAADLCGDTRTDTVNRAVQLYLIMVEEQKFGAQVLLLDPDGRVRRMTFMENPRPTRDPR